MGIGGTDNVRNSESNLQADLGFRPLHAITVPTGAWS